MSEDSRATLTGALWFFCAIALVALFISAAAQGELTPGHIGLAVTILALAIVGTPYLLRMTPRETEEEKKKRQQIGTMLRDMSVDDLIELQRRLSDDDSTEATRMYALGDDGEKVSRI